MLAFRLLVTPPASGAWNMALDAALVESVRGGADAVLRFYRWDPPCLSLGRNQPARDCYDLERLRARGVDVVRRPTGGRAVLHDRELTYSVAVPDRLLGGPRQSYARINRALLRGLRYLGVPAEAQPRGEIPAVVPSLAPCFQDPAEGEVVVHGRKLLGSAQYRHRGVLLQHGSLLFAGDQSAILEFLLSPPAPTPTKVRPATLADLLHPLPSWNELVDALVAGWEEELGTRPGPTDLNADERSLLGRFLDHYRDPAWTWQY